MTAPMVEDQPQYHRNGFYSHESLSKPHRVRIVDAGGLLMVGLLLSVMLATTAGLLLLAVWLFKTAIGLLAGHT